MSWPRLWHQHPGVRKREELSLGERAADVLRNGMGSWTFVFCFLLFMAMWALANTLFHLGSSDGKHGFDPYPYILLNLMLSTMAGLQAAALLIAAKRADQISSEIAIHTEKNTEDIKRLINQNTEMTQAIQALTKEIKEKLYST